MDINSGSFTCGASLLRERLVSSSLNGSNIQYSLLLKAITCADVHVITTTGTDLNPLHYSDHFFLLLEKKLHQTSMHNGGDVTEQMAGDGE